MGDMTEFYLCYGDYDDNDLAEKYYGVDLLMVYEDEQIYKECKMLVIPENYEYKELCEKILEYYEKYHKLSVRQKTALCCLLYEQGIFEIEGVKNEINRKNK